MRTQGGGQGLGGRGGQGVGAAACDSFLHVDIRPEVSQPAPPPAQGPRRRVLTPGMCQTGGSCGRAGGEPQDGQDLSLGPIGGCITASARVSPGGAAVKLWQALTPVPQQPYVPPAQPLGPPSPSPAGGATDQLSKTNLYIRGLHPGTTDQDLVKLCQP